jgi:glutathionyl-hydroquinone reductase
MSWTHSISDNGRFQRKDSSFRDFISSAPGSRFPPAANRYHLYVSLACPWAHRTLIVKRLKGLDAVIGHTVVDWFLDRRTGWRFTDKEEHCEKDPIHGFERLRQVYELADSSYSGNVTVPVLFDRLNDTIVNNESSEIIRMLNSECQTQQQRLTPAACAVWHLTVTIRCWLSLPCDFVSVNEFAATPEQAAVDLYPTSLRPAIDELNTWIYPNINNGVYRAGFAGSQAAYDEAVTAVFLHLDKVESILSSSRYLAGSRLTEADVRLYTTLLRFDPVYYGHFKCNIRRLIDYPSTWHFMLELSQMSAIRPTISIFHIQHHYYASHEHINPTRIVPKGPELDLNAPHGRDFNFPFKPWVWREYHHLEMMREGSVCLCVCLYEYGSAAEAHECW